jgi:hypothetical protein
MPKAGRVCPLQRQRGRRVVSPLREDPVSSAGTVAWGHAHGRTRARLHPGSAALLAALVATSLLSRSAADSSGGDPRGASARGWEFVPLGPEGADLVSVTPLDRQHWLGQSARGQLFCWMPFDSTSAGGAWERMPVCGEGVVHIVARVEGDSREGRVVVLLSDGSLLEWDPQALEGEWTCPPGTEGGDAGPAESTRGNDLAPAGWSRQPRLRRGDLRRWASLPADRALSVVSVLPGNGVPSAPDVLLALRDGTFFGVRSDGSLERWQARFFDPASEQDARRAEDPPPIRIRWAGRPPEDPGVVLALTEWEGLYASRDDARSFSPVGNGLPKGVRFVGAMPGGGLCAACAEGILVCRDPRAGWQAMSEEGAAGEADCREFCALLHDPRNGELLLARTTRGRLMRSQDGGLTWLVVLGDTPVRVRSMIYSLDGRELLLATSRGVLVSRNGGATWEWRNQGLRQAAVQTIAVGRDDEDLFIGTDLGFYARPGGQSEWLARLPCRATEEGLDPATWQRLSGRIDAIDLWESEVGYRLLCLGTEAGPAVGGWDRVAGGCGWSVDGPRQSATSVLTLPGGGVWAAGRTAEGFWAARRDPAGTWGNLDLPDGADAVLDPDGPPATLVLWPAGGDQVLLAGGGLTSLDPARERPSSDGVGSADAGGPDAGAIPGPPGCFILSTACAHRSLWVGTDDGLWRMRDEAAWERMAFGGERAGRVALAEDRPGLVVCRAGGRVYLSGNDGASWQVVPVPEQLRVLGMAIDAEGSHLYLGTQMGLFRVAVPTGVDEIAGDPRIEEYRPLDAQPNPFSTQVVLRGLLGAARVGSALQTEQRETTVRDGVQAPGANLDPTALAASGQSTAGEEEYELLIVNVHGQLVRRIGPGGVSGAEGDAQYVDWSWDGRDERGQAAPKGIYLVSARVGSISYRGKVIKLR